MQIVLRDVSRRVSNIMILVPKNSFPEKIKKINEQVFHDHKFSSVKSAYVLGGVAIITALMNNLTVDFRTSSLLVL